MSDGASVNLPEWDGHPRQMAEVWTLRKNNRVASCHLWTHPKGGEIRLTVDGEWHRGEARSTGLELVDLALEWRKQFEAKAWAKQMTLDPRQKLALKLIERGHAKLSKFAQDSYGMYGRSVTLVNTEPFQLGDPTLIATGMQYHALDDVREMFAGVNANHDSDVLIRMIETYDPAKLAVIMAAVGDGNPVSVKMRLDAPFLVE